MDDADMPVTMESKSVKVTVDETQSLGLDIGALHNILCQDMIADRPVVLVGIAGCLRMGKSFLMSFMMRYLRQKGWRNPQWIGSDETVANVGMRWKSGHQAITVGIVIWNEIFTVENEIGEEIAVLLVDTQGLFEKTMTHQNNTKLFTLTVLMCSSLMFNVTSRIDERELQTLQFFVEYAQTFGQEEKTPFMDLLFLVRDWPDSDEIAYGLIGGKEYLDEILNEQSNPQLDDVRRNLRSSFQTLECFLMPHPGLEVRNKDFSGKNGDVRPDFLTNVTELAEFMLNPTTIHKKFLEGKAPTGRALFTLLSECNKTFQTEKLPTVENMAQAMARARNKAACEEAFTLYEELLQKGIEAAKDKNAVTMSAIHEECQRKALDHFHAASKFGSENERKRFREHLVLNCKKKMETVFEWTEIEKKMAYNASLEMLHGLRSTYRRAMEKDMGGSTKEKRKLLVLHEVHKGESLKTYQSEAAVRAAYFKDHEESLDKDLSRLFVKLQVVNNERETLEGLGSQEGSQEIYEAHMFTHSISQQYRDEFEKYSAVYMEHQHIEKQIETLHQSYLKLFEDNWNSSWPPIEEYRAIFMATLEEECKDAIEINARNKILFDSKLEEYHNRMKVEYRNTMGQVIKETYVEQTQLEEMHDKTQQKLLVEQKKIVSGFAEGIQEKCLEDARRAFCSLFEEFTKLNESNKPFKKLLDAKTLLTIFNKAIECAKVLAPIIMQVMAVVKSAKSAYSAIAPAVSSLEFVVPSAATCAVGAGVVIGVVALSFAAYYVYSTHKQADE